MAFARLPERLSPETSSTSSRELKSDRYKSYTDDCKQEPLKSFAYRGIAASKESVGSVSSFLDSALSTVSDGYFSESFRDSSSVTKYELRFTDPPSSNVTAWRGSRGP